MFPSTLIYVCTALGVGCLSFSIAILQFYKDRVDRFVNAEMQRLLLDKGVSDFIKKMKAKEVTFPMIRDFYRQFVRVNKPNEWLRTTWIYFLVAGLFFILSGVLGSIASSVALGEIESFAYTLLLYALGFLGIGLYNLYRIGRKII